MIKQESFTPSDTQLMLDIDELRSKSNNISRSKMIDLLLHQAVKERNRKKLAKHKDNSQHNSADPRQSNAG